MKRSDESGFALLLVFVMAASVAILLYNELPRLVFESQRVKEQELIDRGEQYQRAIQLYVRKFKKYPASLDDLERGTDIRFLRRRYKDPMTGKKEWRLIHINNAGMYIDSLIHKPKKKDEKKSRNTFITEGAAFGSTGPAPGQGQGNTGAGRRGASDRPAASAGQYQGTGPGAVPGVPYGNPQQPGQGQPGQPVNPANPYYRMRPGGVNAPPGYPSQQPGAAPAYPGIAPGQQQPGIPPRQTRPGAPPPSTGYPGSPGQYVVPGQTAPSGGQRPSPTSPAQYPRQGIPGLPGPYGPRQPASPAQPRNPYAPGGTAPSLLPVPPAPTQPRQGGTPVTPSNPGLKAVWNALTKPRPGGLAGITGAQTQSSGITGGIAGVATKLEAEGIMVYNERTKYNEWEFLYDLRKEQQKKSSAALRGAGVGGGRNPLGQRQSKPGSLFGGSSSGSFGGSPTPPPPPMGRGR